MRYLFRWLYRNILLVYCYSVFGKKVNCYGIFKVLRPENVTIGNDCHINYGVFILGHSNISIGNRVTLSARCILLDAGLEIGVSQRRHINSFVRIEDDAWIGAGATILPGVTVGKASIVGAGSVVTKDVPPHSIVAGNPARVVREIDSLDNRVRVSE